MAKFRNIIAVLAIILTTVLFTALFTIAVSQEQTFQEQNFRQMGGAMHGSFKNLTREQLEILQEDSLIREAATRLFLGMPQDAPFRKDHVEVSYMDALCAKYSFCNPEEGRLPQEGTMEAAVDTRVLQLLGVEPRLGEEFTITYNLGNIMGEDRQITTAFTLCGWWEYDAASTASHILVPLSYAQEVLSGYERQGEQDTTGTWDLNVMLSSSLRIREDLETVLGNHGYQGENSSGENYIALGVGWAFTGAQLSQNMDVTGIAGAIAALLLIVFSGYLIIYNVFRISVTGDIRYYGLLKTIGTTGRQIKRILRIQAIWLSVIGIPIGLLLGWLAGSVLTPVVMSSMGYEKTSVSAHPLIFLTAALFSFITVLLSLRKPAKLAARVSPVEAVRYTESSMKKKAKKGERGGKVSRMALANLGRSKSKTVLVVASLSLAVVLLNITVTFTNGFDMDKYLEKFVCTDFIYGHADYFRSGFRNELQEIGEDMISQIENRESITESGRIYGQTDLILQYVPEELLRERYAPYYEDMTELDAYLDGLERDEQGLVEDSIRLYGMEGLPLSMLTAIDGDLSKLLEKGWIAAVIMEDDYGKPQEDTNHYQVGDRVKVLYVDEYDYIDSATGESADESTPEERMELKIIRSHEAVYTVCARVTMRSTMSYRRYGTEEMILPAEEFTRQTESSALMTYLFNTTKETNQSMEEFLKEFTGQIETAYDYESKQSYVDLFDNYRNMFLLMGTVLSIIVGMIGVLNYVNAIVTGVISRKREFAILQAVGMTGSQMKKMLILEGGIYGILAILLALLLDRILSPLIGGVLGSMFWFYSHHATIVPILCVLPAFLLFGILIPLIAYRVIGRQTLVERIRESET